MLVREIGSQDCVVRVCFELQQVLGARMYVFPRWSLMKISGNISPLPQLSEHALHTDVFHLKCLLLTFIWKPDSNSE